jgi:hypothetical protein
MQMNFSTDPDLYVPHVIVPLEPLLNAYNSKQRVILGTVFAMINGQRAVWQIKAQLHLSSKTVDEVLSHMQQIGVIE